MFRDTALCQKVNNKHMLAQNDKNGQWTDPSTGESHDKSCPKMTKMANERTLQQGNSL